MRVAVVLFNLGGPDRPEAVRPFLKNLFSDPAILRVPFFVRPLLANLIASRRQAPAAANYELLGGKSPLLELTQAQADGLQEALRARGVDARCFIAMRYWHPFSDETLRDVAGFNPDRVLLLPLYPQFSGTTTGSSLTAWREAAADAGFAADVTTLCCWFAEPGFVQASAKLIRAGLDHARASQDRPVRVLFSAHGLPESIVRNGDPYQHQVEQTVAALVAALGEPDLDHMVCYQSRATPQKWIEPSTEQAIEQAGQDERAVLVVPVAFVSDHSETLVELDIEYRDFAREHGVEGYFRVPAQNSDAGFIAALAEMAVDALARGPGLCSFSGGRACPAGHRDCPFGEAA